MPVKQDRIGNYSIEALEKRLINLPKEIYDQSIISIQKKEMWLRAKAEYDLGMAKTSSMGKLQNAAMTQTDIKAKAIEDNYQKRIDMIVAESEYKRSIAEMRKLKDGLESIQQLSYLRRIYIT